MCLSWKRLSYSEVPDSCTCSDTCLCPHGHYIHISDDYLCCYFVKVPIVLVSFCLLCFLSFCLSFFLSSFLPSFLPSFNLSVLFLSVHLGLPVLFLPIRSHKAVTYCVVVDQHNFCRGVHYTFHSRTEDRFCSGILRAIFYDNFLIQSVHREERLLKDGSFV